MTHDDVQGWLDRYVEAWHSYDPAAIGDLFAEDATYRYHAYDPEPVAGRDAIVADWLDGQDAPGSWEAHYEPFAVEGERAVAVGESRYLKPDGSQRTSTTTCGRSASTATAAAPSSSSTSTSCPRASAARADRPPLRGVNRALTRVRIIRPEWHERSSSSKTSRPCARRSSMRSRPMDSGSWRRPTGARR